MKGRSLGRRLIAGAALWVALALLASGLVLYELFRAHVTAALEAALIADLNQVIAALEVDADGAPRLVQRPANPLFERPYSGRYWQVNGGEVATLTSRSLWDTTLLLPDDALPDGALHRHVVIGPGDRPLLALERSMRLPEHATPLRVTIAAALAEIDEPLRRFGTTLALSLLALGIGLVGAVVLQVRIGLQPLTRLRTALGELQGGKRTRLTGAWPSEIRPLVDDFDGVLEQNARFLERARTQAGNLAHALKTPLSILRNAAEDTATPLAAVVRAQVDAMQTQVDHHLARARAAAAAQLPGAHANVSAIAQQLSRTLTKLYAARGIDIDVQGDRGAVFRGEAEDLMELLGNLLDNACKWAHAHVVVRLTAGERLVITVDDDGPGLAPEHRETALRRGARLDESAPGSGLGLAIVRDLVDAYGGALALDTSPLGGLRVRLELPGGQPPG